MWGWWNSDWGKRGKFAMTIRPQWRFTCGSFDQVVSYVQGIDGPKRLHQTGGVKKVGIGSHTRDA